MRDTMLTTSSGGVRLGVGFQGDQTPAAAARAITVPVGSPVWVSPALIQKTIGAWQRYYPHQLTSDDALEILMDYGALIDVLMTTEGEG